VPEQVNNTAIKVGKGVRETVNQDAALEQEFRLPRTQLLTDISDFLKQLENIRLVGDHPSLADRRGLFSRWLVDVEPNA